MDTQITNWEMAQEADIFQEIKEGLASGPMEPYHPSIEEINMN